MLVHSCIVGDPDYKEIVVYTFEQIWILCAIKSTFDNPHLRSYIVFKFQTGFFDNMLALAGIDCVVQEMRSLRLFYVIATAVLVCGCWRLLIVLLLNFTNFLSKKCLVKLYQPRFCLPNHSSHEGALSKNCWSLFMYRDCVHISFSMFMFP
jgi:hypothetical protein